MRQSVRSASSKLVLTRVRTQLGPPDDGGGEKNAGQVVSGELVIARRDAAEVFEPGEHSLDEVSLTIGFPVMRDKRLAPGDGGDDRFNVALLEVSSQAVSVVGFVGDQSFDRWSSGQQLLRHHDVVEIARGDQ